MAEVTTVFYANAIVGIIDARMTTIMADIGSTAVNDIKTLMRNSPATGRIYGKHRASAPGEPPAPDHGDLLRSIQWRAPSRVGNAWAVEIGSTLKKALFLEHGAARGVRDANGRVVAVAWILFPRPAWEPGLRITRTKIPGIFQRHAGG